MGLELPPDVRLQLSPHRLSPTPREFKRLSVEPQHLQLQFGSHSPLHNYTVPFLLLHFPFATTY